MKLSKFVKKGIAITCGLYVFQALGTGLLIRVLVSGLVTEAINNHFNINQDIEDPLKTEVNVEVKQ